MTATNNQPQHSPLKVVPPKSRAKAPAVTPPQGTSTSSTPTPAKAPASPKPYGKWLMMVLLLVGGAAIAQMPIPNYVRGEGEITSRIEARQRITMPVSGTVQLKVKSHQLVTAGEVVAEVASPDLDNQIAEAERNLQQGKALLSAAGKRLTIAETRLEAAKTNEAISLERAKKQRQEIEAIVSGEKLPRIRQLEREMEGIESEIAGIRNEIDGVESQITGIQEEIEEIERDRLGLQEEFQTVQKLLEAYEIAAAEGALSKAKVWETQREESAIKSQIEQRSDRIDVKRQQIRQTESEIRQRENLIEQKYRLIEAKAEQIKEIEKQVKDLLSDRENEVEQQVAARRSAETEVAAAKTAVDSEMQQLSQAEAELKRLRDRQTELTLNTNTTGTVLTSDLDLINNTTLPFGEEILQIVDLAQLTATVQIPQEDGNLVKLNQPVVFTLRDPYSPKYKATVTEILPKIVVDESGSNPMLTVQILIDNQNNSLLPGSEGFAHIATGEMRVYEKVKHEFDKLFELNKYFPGFSDNPE